MVSIARQWAELNYSGLAPRYNFVVFTIKWFGVNHARSYHYHVLTFTSHLLFVMQIFAKENLIDTCFRDHFFQES